jgi:acetyl-CoA C-acetyltransferase
VVDSVIGALTDPFESVLMGVTAENVAERASVSRERQDEFAVRSHRRAAAAREQGRFDAQIVPVEIKAKRETVQFTRDEHIREDASFERMAALKPAFKPDGSVTAGNSSGMNDAGAAVVLMSRARATELGVPVRARILAYASCGVDPAVMGIGPIPAVRKVLERAGAQLSDVQVIELNEAFAAQVLPVCAEVGVDPFSDKLNPHGGAIALGHPYGMTGARIMCTLLNDLETLDRTIGLETMCVGGGQGMAMLVERLN